MPKLESVQDLIYPVAREARAGRSPSSTGHSDYGAAAGCLPGGGGAASIGAISLQSVYDALALLVTEGLIRRIQPAGSPARFEDRVGDNHHHLICRICGRLVDIDCATGAAPCLTASDDMGYEIDEAEVAYWGRCPECVAQSRPPSSSESPALRRRNRQRPESTDGPSSTDRKEILPD